MAFYEVLVQRPRGEPRAGVRVHLAGDDERAEGETDDDGRVVLEIHARVAELYVGGRREGIVRPGTLLVTR